MVSETHWVLSVFWLQNGRLVWTREIWMIIDHDHADDEHDDEDDDNGDDVDEDHSHLF